MLAQSFYVTDPTFDTPGVYATGINLFFAKLPTDNNIGITVSINEMENGTPTGSTLPFAKCRYTTELLKSIYLTGANGTRYLDAGNTAAQFTFGIPVFLRTQKEYALVINVDGDHPDVEMWCSELNGTDIVSNSKIATNPSIGVLFTSSNGRTWTPYQTEDLKFTISGSNFPSLTGNIIMTNANTEYVQREVVAQTRPYLRGEKIYVSNGVIGSSNVYTGKTSTVITLYPANTQYSNAVNKMIYLSSNGQSQTDIRSVVSVINNAGNTQITLNRAPTFNDSNATLGFLYSNGALYADECYVNGSRDLILHRSTANSTMNFRELMISKNNQSLLIGAISGTAANLYSLGAIPYDEIVPQLAYVEPPKTSLNISFKGAALGSNTIDSAYTTLMFDKNTKFLDKTRLVRSLSDELYFDSGTKSLQVKIDFSSNSSYLSPALNDIKKSVLLLHNKISHANTQLLTNEMSPAGGKMGNKYISKSVLLTTEAEDLVVYLTAYRPANTEVYVFCKLLHEEDGESIDNKYWTLMEEVTPKPYSSKVDLSDLKELQYVIPSGDDATITATAFKNANNSNIVRYYDDNGDGSYFDGYSTFAIKIILESDQSHIVPRVGDMRAIAVQV
jgi:hypothetical protein